MGKITVWGELLSNHGLGKNDAEAPKGHFNTAGDELLEVFLSGLYIRILDQKHGHFHVARYRHGADEKPKTRFFAGEAPDISQTLSEGDVTKFLKRL